MEMIEIHVTCPDEATAKALGRAAIEARLAACANVWGPLRSLYHWKGAIEDDPEWALTLKTRGALFRAAATLIRERHPYEVPAILCHAVTADAPTADWIAAETRPEG